MNFDLEYTYEHYDEASGGASHEENSAETTGAAAGASLEEGRRGWGRRIRSGSTDPRRRGSRERRGRALEEGLGLLRRVCSRTSCAGDPCSGTSVEGDTGLPLLAPGGADDDACGRPDTSKRQWRRRLWKLPTLLEADTHASLSPQAHDNHPLMQHHHHGYENEEEADVFIGDEAQGR